MTTVGHTGLVNVARLKGEHSICCPQFAATGTMLWLDGHSHQLRTGSDTRRRSWLSVSTFTVVHLEQSGQLDPDCWLVGMVMWSGASISSHHHETTFPGSPTTLTPICFFSLFLTFPFLAFLFPPFFFLLSFSLSFFLFSLRLEIGNQIWWILRYHNFNHRQDWSQKIFREGRGLTFHLFPFSLPFPFFYSLAFSFFFPFSFTSFPLEVKPFRSS